MKFRIVKYNRDSLPYFIQIKYILGWGNEVGGFETQEKAEEWVQDIKKRALPPEIIKEL